MTQVLLKDAKPGTVAASKLFEDLEMFYKAMKSDNLEVIKGSFANGKKVTVNDLKGEFLMECDVVTDRYTTSMYLTTGKVA